MYNDVLCSICHTGILKARNLLKYFPPFHTQCMPAKLHPKLSGTKVKATPLSHEITAVHSLMRTEKCGKFPKSMSLN